MLAVILGALLFPCLASRQVGPPVATLYELLLQIRDAVPHFDAALLAAPMLGRPTDTSVTVSTVVSAPAWVYAEYGPGPDALGESTDTLEVAFDARPVNPVEMSLTDLPPGAECSYRIMLRGEADTGFREVARGSFRTQRPRGDGFAFTVQADSHINELFRSRSQGRARIYDLVLRNALADRPDFHIDMGDFAGIEWYTGGKAPGLDTALERYLLQRVFLSRLSPWVPFYLVLGNHEGEQGWRRGRETDSLEVVGALARKALIPNPHPDAFYTGSTEVTECCGLREDYYAWEWGDALFVVLDPFWNTMRMPHRSGAYEPSDDPWDWTLGLRQYNWLYETLHASDAAWKFVFSHHVTGGYRYGHGRFHPYGRGGIVVAKHKVAGQPTFEWGGEDETGAYVFEEKRPGWTHGAVHDMMVAEGVDIFFHGHDHVFVCETLDGIAYQACPQPSSPRYSNGFFEPEMYQGVKRNNSGHIRVTVSADSVRVDYVRAVLPEDEPLDEEGTRVANGDVSYTYTLRR
jgi:hypothetical protein